MSTKCILDNRFTDDVHWKGGSLIASQMLSWASIMFAWNARYFKNHNTLSGIKISNCSIISDHLTQKSTLEMIGNKLGRIDQKKLPNLGQRNGQNIRFMMTTGSKVPFVKIGTKYKFPFWPLVAGTTCIRMRFFAWLKNYLIAGVSQVPGLIIGQMRQFLDLRFAIRYS